MDRLILYFNRPGCPSNILNKKTAMENLAYSIIGAFFSQKRITYLEILYLLTFDHKSSPSSYSSILRLRR